MIIFDIIEEKKKHIYVTKTLWVLLCAACVVCGVIRHGLNQGNPVFSYKAQNLLFCRRFGRASCRDGGRGDAFPCQASDNFSG